jgi:uncharacterized heparinase superfamily protein
MKTDALWRIIRTSRHLRASQVAWRLRYVVERSLPVQSDRFALPANLSPGLRTDFPVFPVENLSEERTGLVEMLAAGVLRLLNREGHLGFDRPDWHLGPCKSQRLWTITLNYHEWLYRLAEVATSEGPEASQATRLFKHYLSDWLENCDLHKPGARELAWNAYAIATRIGWWIRSFRLMPRSFWEDEGDLGNSFLRSLWKQAAFLHEHLEHDLLANHLLRDTVGLAWAGRFFDAHEAGEWLKIATRIAVEQAREQVLTDGGHVERSPMYHIHVMDDLHWLAHLLEDDVARDQMRIAWQRMAASLAWMRHPDGNIPLLNDAAFNGSCTPASALERGQSLCWAEDTAGPKGGKLFAEWGLYVWHGDPWTVFFDVGPIGIDYQPGHGHADTLTLEASFRGHRLWVDPGTWGYDLDYRRAYDRSTTAHNTVCVDDSDSSEVWHIFRCGRRALPSNVTATGEGSAFHASAGHDGYRHLRGKPFPTRSVTLHHDRRLVIADRCQGRGTHRLSGGWLLAPGWIWEAYDGGWRVHRQGCGALRITMNGPAGLKLTESPRMYHPEFGAELVTTRLEWSVETALPAEITTIQEPE